MQIWVYYKPNQQIHCRILTSSLFFQNELFSSVKLADSASEGPGHLRARQTSKHTVLHGGPDGRPACQRAGGLFPPDCGQGQEDHCQNEGEEDVENQGLGGHDDCGGLSKWVRDQAVQEL